jgi:hypothetical protein
MKPKPKESVYISLKDNQWVAIFKDEEIFSDPDQDKVIGMVLNKLSGENFWLKIENQSGALRQATSIGSDS